MEVSIVVPAFNEERIIEGSVLKLKDFARKNKFTYELIVVDDGSTDKTSDIVKKFKDVKLVRYPYNKGKGYAIRQGILAAKKKNIVIIDADLPWDLNLMHRLLDFRGHDLSIGSRAVSTSVTRTRPTFLRRILGHAFSMMTSAILHLGIGDTQSGFKAFKKDVARKIFSRQRINGWAFDVEVLYLAKKYGYTIQEVPIDKVEKLDFRVSKLNPFRDPMKMFCSLLKIRWNDFRKRY